MSSLFLRRLDDWQCSFHLFLFTPSPQKQTHGATVLQWFPWTSRRRRNDQNFFSWVPQTIKKIKSILVANESSTGPAFGKVKEQATTLEIFTATVPIGSMYGIFLPTRMVDFYDKCRHIYQSHGSYGVWQWQLLGSWKKDLAMMLRKFPW